MTNSPLRNSIKAQMSKQSQTSIKTSVLSKGSMTSHVSCKQTIKKIPDNGPSLCTPSWKGVPSVATKTNATRRERTLQKFGSFPRHTQKDNTIMKGLYNTLIQINHTDLARSPYFGSLSNILSGKDLVKKRSESKKLPTLKNCLNQQRTSTSSMKINKAIQTTGPTSKPDSRTKAVKTKGKSTICKNEDSKIKCSSTKLPIVAQSKGALKQKPSNNNLKVSLPSKMNIQKGNTIDQRPPPAKYLGYWDNEIRNYYNWTSFCLMRRYRSDTKKLKEQLKCLGREGCSINDVIWREAETFRKNIERDRKKLNEVLKVTTKDKPTKKKRCSNKKLSSKNCDSLPVIRTPERKKCGALVPPPSATESLFSYRKISRPPTPTLTTDSMVSPTKKVSRSISDHSIFPGGNSGQFISKGLQYRSQVSDPSFDATETNNTPSLNEQHSKFKSKFTLKSERLSFKHLKKAIR